MKKTAIIALLVATAAISSFGQGQVNFNNRATGVNAPVYGVNPSNPTLARSGNASTNGGTIDYTGHPLLAGTTFTAALLYGGDSANLTTYSTTTFRTTTSLLGYVNPIANPTTAPLTPQSYRVRAWDNGGNAASTYADALAAGRAVGESGTFVLTGTVSPATPPNLLGLTSFNLTVVPEPGVIALGVLGLGALLLRRRK